MLAIEIIHIKLHKLRRSCKINTIVYAWNKHRNKTQCRTLFQPIAAYTSHKNVCLYNSNTISAKWKCSCTICISVWCWMFALLYILELERLFTRNINRKKRIPNSELYRTISFRCHCTWWGAMGVMLKRACLHTNRKIAFQTWRSDPEKKENHFGAKYFI